MKTAISWLEPGHSERFAALGLGDLIALRGRLSEDRLAELAEPPAPLTRARTRRLYRLPPELGGGARLFVKLQHASAASLPPRKWLSYSTRPSPLMRELHAASTLHRLGFLTPPYVAYGARGRFPATLRAVLISREVPGMVDLEALLGSDAPMAAKESSIDAVEAAVKAVHKKLFALGGARYRDFLVPLAGATSPDEVVFLDAVALGRSPLKRRRDQRQLQQDRARFG